MSFYNTQAYVWNVSGAMAGMTCVVVAVSEDQARRKLWIRYGIKNDDLNHLLEQKPTVLKDGDVFLQT